MWGAVTISMGARSEPKASSATSAEMSVARLQRGVANGGKWRALPVDFPPFLWNMTASSRWDCHKTIGW